MGDESYWVDKSREELSEILSKRNFTVKKDKVTYSNPEVPRVIHRRPKMTNEEQRIKVRKHQIELRENGLCEAGCGNRPEINPLTSKQYTKCKYHRELKAKWHQTYIRKRDK